MSWFKTSYILVK